MASSAPVIKRGNVIRNPPQCLGNFQFLGPNNWSIAPRNLGVAIARYTFALRERFRPFQGRIQVEGFRRSIPASSWSFTHMKSCIIKAWSLSKAFGTRT